MNHAPSDELDPGPLPERPWRRVAWSALPGTRIQVGSRGRPEPGAAPDRRGQGATCVLLAGEDPDELEAAGISALAQTRPFDEILVAEPDPEGRAGELERLQHTVSAAAGELVFFLRAEDRYEPEHLERCLAVYAAHPGCGLVDSAYRRFGRREELVRRRDAQGPPRIQAALARTRDPARLAPPALSALSLSREVLTRVLPLPAEVLDDWPSQPCEPLLRAVLASGRLRGHVPEPGVRVRVDDAALDSRRDPDPTLPYRRRLALARLLGHLDARLGHGPALAGLAAAEYRALERPSRAELAAYLELALQGELGLGARLGLWLSILTRHLRAGRR